MKSCLIIALCVATAIAAEYYTTKYDNLDIDNILFNKRLYKNYFNCLIDQGNCNEDGKTLKSVIPDALITGCSKCNEHQKKSVEKVIKHIYKEEPADWQKLLSKYDPDGKYQEHYKHYFE